MKKSTTSRRSLLKQIGLAGASGTAAAFGLNVSAQASPSQKLALGLREGFNAELRQRVDSTPMVDSHEHLPDEHVRLRDNRNCIRLFEHYLSDDFASAGLERDSAFGRNVAGEEPVVLWRRLEPFWNAVKNTGYGQALRITVRELYGIDRIDESAIPRLQQAFEKLAAPGFYEKVLRTHCNIESCQVDQGLYTETAQPTLLLQDINFSRMKEVTLARENFARVGMTQVNDLNDYHEFLRRWFQKYAAYATAVKSAIAYRRGLDFERVPAELAEAPFKKRRENARLSEEETKLLQDHLFWFCVALADEHNLPVKLHLGYYVGNNTMPVSRIEKNVGQASELCLLSPKTRFVFMHTAYPYGRELISVAKQFPGAHLQSCWAWIIDPCGTKDFLKRYIVSAPSNKIHVFGGDYNVVENVAGHARLARNGVYAALSELVEEGYLSREDALELVEPLLRGNARRIFQLEKKYEAARNVPWIKKG